MTWKFETSSSIDFISPKLNSFTAKWKHDDRSFEKKLGVFDPPMFKGSIVQDMNVKSTSYPLTVYFDGYDNFDKADKFWKALNTESGVWTITHPTKGNLELQLVSAKEVVNPIDNGNFTQFDTVWLEPAKINNIISSPALSAMTLLSVLNSITDAIAQVQQLKSDLYAAVQSGLNAINNIVGFANSVMTTLAALDNQIKDLWSSAQYTLTNAMSLFQSTPSDSTVQSDLCNALADVVMLPLEVNSDYSNRFSVYSDMITDLTGIVPTASANSTNIISDVEMNYNTIIFLEFGIIASLLSLCRIIVTSDYKTRADVLSAMDNLTTTFNSTINVLETAQSLFQGQDIDFQYFSQSQSYTNLENTFSLVMQYLISQFFNLASEKRFTLKSRRSPIEITATEYTTGNFDDNYELFITSNNLNGNEILLLQPGREIVIYVQ